MPANLTPQYQKAEEEYRRAQSSDEQIVCLERMLQLIPKHKGTEKLQADLKSRLKETREQRESEQRSAAKKGPSYRYPRQGAGTVIVLGGPNSGKSRILDVLTKATPQVADFPFTTREPLPAMMPWNDTSVQLIDTPPVTESHFETYLLNLVRTADAVVLCFDGSSDDAPEDTVAVIRQLASRKTKLSNRSGFDEDDFSVVHVRTLLVATRGHDPECADRLEFLSEMIDVPFETLPVNLDDPDSAATLRDRIFELLGVIRVYTKRPGKPAEYADPFPLKHPATVEDLAARVHHDMAENLKFARVWGTSAMDGQSVGRDHQLADRDMVELHC